MIKRDSRRWREGCDFKKGARFLPFHRRAVANGCPRRPRMRSARQPRCAGPRFRAPPPSLRSDPSDSDHRRSRIHAARYFRCYGPAQSSVLTPRRCEGTMHYRPHRRSRPSWSASQGARRHEPPSALIWAKRGAAASPSWAMADSLASDPLQNADLVFRDDGRQGPEVELVVQTRANDVAVMLDPAAQAGELRVAVQIGILIVCRRG